MKERRYKIYLMNNKSYDADEADIEKLKAHANEMLVQLKQVMVHPSSVSAIEPYFVEWIRPSYLNPTSTSAVMLPAKPPDPIVDLFSDELKKLT